MEDKKQIGKIVADNLLRLLPNHKCGLTIDHNLHLSFYETVAQRIGHLDDYLEWVDDAARAKCIELNELWEMTWFPDTPVGSYSIGAATLSELLVYAIEMNSEGNT